ncbi:MAG: ADP-ribosylglycohydrolase family protein [Clostridiales bacterium]|nr:ADP-ribosylglycohydrolase family protein [Clostridiales bacterium]
MKISNQLALLRLKEGITAEEFAKKADLPEKDYIAWENGDAEPNPAEYEKIYSTYGLITDEIPNCEIDYVGRPSWESFSKNIMNEFAQLADEGFDVEPYREFYEKAAQMEEGVLKETLCDILFRLSQNYSITAHYKYNEPSDLEEIKKLCDKNLRPVLKAPDDKEKYRNMAAGAWYGRICGCILGKPIEGYLPKEIEDILKVSNNYPMDRYICKKDFSGESIKQVNFVAQSLLADEMGFAVFDDDTNYTVMAQMLIDKYGRDFKTNDVGELWMSLQPKSPYCTAERIAFINLCNGLVPPTTAKYKNVYREWIGAQIRGDYFGYINPCDPETAADMAFRDAALSHTKNGIYGEMYIAATIAAAFGSETIEQAVNAGLSVIPATSRLFEAIKAVLKMHTDGKTCNEILRYIGSKYDASLERIAVHTIPNAMIVTAALISYPNDFDKAVCIAVQTGFDTDCNGATVGSVLGAFLGRKAIKEKWTAPLNSTLETTICGKHTIPIEQLIDKTVSHYTR